MCYRKFASINKRVFSAEIRKAFAVTSETRIASVDNYNSAIETIVNKHAPIVTRVTTVRSRTPWHTEVLSCAKRDLRRAERRWRKTRLTVHRQTFRDGCRQTLAATKVRHFCIVISEAGHNIKTMFGVTNAILLCGDLHKLSC